MSVIIKNGKIVREKDRDQKKPYGHKVLDRTIRPYGHKVLDRTIRPYKKNKLLGKAAESFVKKTAKLAEEKTERAQKLETDLVTPYDMGGLDVGAYNPKYCSQTYNGLPSMYTYMITLYIPAAKKELAKLKDELAVLKTEEIGFKKYINSYFDLKTSDEKKDKCVICLEAHKGSLILKCGHLFHKSCIRKQIFRRDGRCALCRTIIF